MLPLVFILATAFLQAPVSATQTPDARAHARSTLAALAAGDFGRIEADFTAEMQKALPSGRLAATWAALQRQAGAFKSCEAEPRVAKIADKEMVITACAFERATIDVQFAFDTSGRISGLVFRPVSSAASAYTLPSYAKASAYTESEKTIGSAEWPLPGTLTLPAGARSAPAVVLVHGSGPNDRDETIGGNKPFKDLATGLASRGIAVLRYDKRSRVHAGKMAGASFTVQQEVIDDVLEAMKVLRSEPAIDRARIFVLGHSLGAMLAPRIWMADSSVAGVIMLAGPAQPLEEAIVAQSRYLAAADGTTSAEEQQAIDNAEALARRVRALQPEDAKGGDMIAGAPASYWLDLRSYDPTATATKVKAPMLILQGGRDYQVRPEEFAKWGAVLGARGDVRLRSYPPLNHLFIAGSGPSLPAEYLTPGHVAEEVIVDIANWILAQRE
jgi:dienelactone hydrolase